MSDEAKKIEETEEQIVHGPKVETPHGTPLGQHAEIIEDGKLKGQQKDYIVLSEYERSKGFVRPLRDAYVHVGKRPKYPTRELTADEKERYDVATSANPYVLYEEFPEEMRPRLGRLWTKKDLESGCGKVTTMSRPLAETYARDPKFYSGTFCSTCRTHFDVGENGEFVWFDTDIRVGT